MVMELGIIASHLIWMYRYRHIRNRTKGEKPVRDPIKTSKAHISWFKSWENIRIFQYKQPTGNVDSFTSQLVDEEAVKRPETAVYCSKEGELFRYSAVI
jgi:hypothetical protein